MYHNPQIDSIFLNGHNGAGVLVLHGFTGTPDSMRSTINALHQQGFTVSAPLLAGHGTTPEQCAETGWQDWFNSAQKAYLELHAKCSRIFVCGLSLGSLLTLKLSIEYPEFISGIACLATPLFFKPWVRKVLPLVNYSPLKYFWKFQKKFDVDLKDPQAKGNFWNYDQMPVSSILSIHDLQIKVQMTLSSIKTPTILIHSRHDSTAPYESMAYITQHVASTVTETVTLENSYHIVTLDYEKEVVAQKVCQFFTRFL